MGEDLYELPKGWVWASIGEIANIETGATPLRSKKEYYESGTIPWVTSSALNDLFIKQADEKITELALKETNCKVFPIHTLLIAMYGEGKTRGKVSELLINAATNQACAALIFEDYILELKPYIKFYLQKNYDDIRCLSSGGVQPNLNLGIIKSTKIPFAPLPEQHRIVAKIEELFTELDAGVELLKKLKAKLKRYRQAVLKAAVEGNLTKEWREANQGKLEPASMLRDRILKQRREKWEAEQLAKMKAQGKTPKDDSWKLKYQEPIAPDTSDLPELPDGWCWVSLEELSWDSRYGTSEKCDYNFLGSPVLRIPNIVEGSIVLDDLKYAANDNKLEAIDPLTYGDFLVIRTNGSKDLIGRAALVTQAYDKSYFFASYLIRFRLIAIDSLPIWINKIWNTFRIRTWIETRAATSAGQHNISQTVLNKLPLEIPSLLEQKKILEEIERIFSLIDQLEKTIDANLKRAEKLRQSILKQAFEGKLVPQNPNDEPAEKLLERIKAEKAKQTTTKTKRKTQSKTQSSIQLEFPLE